MTNRRKRKRAVAAAASPTWTKAKEEAADTNSSVVVVGIDKEKDNGKGLGLGCYEYEKVREERIKENLERIQKLGIIDLSLSLKSELSNANGRRGQAHHSHKTLPPLPDKQLPPRRSSRLQNASPVSYAEFCAKEKESSVRNGLPFVVQGDKEEVYTDEHAALLGTCETSWTLFMDGYDKDGRRIYDQIKGKTCHQCRQKTLGRHTHCSKCNLVQGQFCGDCLYMRYGENVLEVEKNVNWICPVCRGICNCSLCRTKKGWAPTGALYKKVLHQGFKSVAHYLIQTRRSQTSSEDQTCAQRDSSSKALIPFSDIADASGLNTIDSKKGLNSEITDKSSNGFQTSLISFVDPEMPSHPQESLMVENGVDMGSDMGSFEEGSSDLNREGRPQCADGEHTLGHISKGSVVRPRDKSKKAKEPGEVEKLRPDSIAGRLRRRVKSPTV